MVKVHPHIPVPCLFSVISIHIAIPLSWNCPGAFRDETLIVTQNLELEETAESWSVLWSFRGERGKA